MGHHEGEPQYFALIEPPTAKFTYMQGLCLLTSAHDKQPFSTRAICQRLGPETSRLEWEDKIGVFTNREFKRLFDNAEIVMRAIGDEGVLVGSNH